MQRTPRPLHPYPDTSAFPHIPFPPHPLARRAHRGSLEPVAGAAMADCGGEEGPRRQGGM